MKAILVMEMPENCEECPLKMDVESGIQIDVKCQTGVRWCRCQNVRYLMGRMP